MYKAHPWITRGIQNPCKKKKTLYKEIARQRSKEAEIKYKTSKNKLINIIGISRGDYYSKVLNDNKNITKEIYNILNKVIIIKKCFCE